MIACIRRSKRLEGRQQAIPATITEAGATLTAADPQGSGECRRPRPSCLTCDDVQELVLTRSARRPFAGGMPLRWPTEGPPAVRFRVSLSPPQDLGGMDASLRCWTLRARSGLPSGPSSWVFSCRRRRSSCRSYHPAKDRILCGGNRGGGGCGCTNRIGIPS
jgi:hypothetical protein